MIRINLLPHRELKRKARQQKFSVFAGIACFLGLMIVWSVHVVITDELDYQNSRNQFLTNQIAVLDAKIEEIRNIKEKTADLLKRKDIVEGLQASRNEVVHFFDQLVRLLPDGVHIHSVKQDDQMINIVGYAQSNTLVSTLMRNLESSVWLGDPLLIEIKAINLDNRRINEFNLNVELIQSVDNSEVEMLL